MKRPRTPARPSYHLEIDFECQVRQASPVVRGQMLGWLRRWRRRPERVFWLIDGTGRWKRI